MSVFRVAANANELNVYDRTHPLVAGSLPIAPNFQSSMTINKRETILEINDFEEDDFWVSFYISKGTNNDASGGRYVFALYDASISTTVPLMGIIKAVSSGSLPCEIRRWNGSSAVLMGEININAANTLFRVDIHYRAHATNGLIAVYLDNNQVAEYTGNTFSTKANMVQLRKLNVSGTGTATSQFTCFSGFFMSTTDSRAITLVERRPQNIGAFNDWTGAASNVVPSNDEITTFIETNAPNKRKSFTYAAPAAIADREIIGVILSSVQRESIEGYAPTAPFFRTSDGVNLDTDPVSVGDQYALVQRVLPDNGGQPWTYEALVTGQMGVLSAD